MFFQVASLLRDRASWLLAGRYDLIASGYLYPLPVYLASSRVIVRSHEEAMSMLVLQRAAYISRGVVALDPHVTAMDLPRAGRFRIWVDWHELTALVEETRKSTAIYYCRQTPAGLQIEMVDYTQLSMPELQPHFAALALSA